MYAAKESCLLHCSDRRGGDGDDNLPKSFATLMCKTDMTMRYTCIALFYRRRRRRLAAPAGHFGTIRVVSLSGFRLMSSSRRAINAENRRCASFEVDSRRMLIVSVEHGSKENYLRSNELV